jgi:hypothetical protein
VEEIYSRPLDGSGFAVKLNGPLTPGGDVRDFKISPDSSRVVYRADQDTAGTPELYSRPLDGCASAVKLNGPLAIGAFVWGFEISPDSSRMVYIADQDTAGVSEIYSRPLDGSGSAVKLNGTLPSPGYVEPSAFLITPNSSLVVYETYNLAGVEEIYSRPLDGSGFAVRLNDPLTPGSYVGLFAVSPDSKRVVYYLITFGLGELYSKHLDGSGSAVKLNGTLTPGGFVRGFAISPDSSRVVYFADQDTASVSEIYSRPLDGSGSAVKLNGPLTPGGDAWGFAISPDSRRVIYVADQDTNDMVELYSTVLNLPPVAVCQNVTVAAGSNCTASASVNNGSYDPDGDPITFTQSSPGPYPKGNTLVTLTVTDSKGASSQCTGTVTVVDTTSPTITTASANPSVLWPPNNKMINVTINYNVSDNCDQPTCNISSVTCNESISSSDYTIVDAHHVRLRAELGERDNHYFRYHPFFFPHHRALKRLENDDDRIYTINITCRDASGNSSNQALTVSVPYDKDKHKDRHKGIYKDKHKDRHKDKHKEKK